MTPGVQQVIAVFNQSTAMANDEAETIVAAVDKQFQSDFNPAWDTNVTVKFYADPKSIPADEWQLGLFDNSDQAGALGYHDYNSNGGPLGKAFVGTDKQVGDSPSVTISHEAMEMAADPDITRTYFITLSSSDVTVYALEVCDPVESDHDGYQIDGVLVSNFITPAWYDPGKLNQQGAKFDHQGVLTRPFTIQPDGYLSVWTPSGGWQQASHSAARTNPAVRNSTRIGSRMEKRRVGRDEWRTSAPLIA